MRRITGARIPNAVGVLMSVALAWLAFPALAPAEVPTAFTAGDPPFVFAGSGERSGATTEEISSEVDPNGETTTYHVTYGLAGSIWCTSGGTSGSPEHATSTQTLGFTDGTFHEVSVPLSGLATGSEYCAELVASNASATGGGGQLTFVAGAPIAVTGSAQPTGAKTEEVSGEVNPVGQTTTYHVAYGLASSSWCTSGGTSGSPEHATSAQTLGFTNTTSHSVVVTLSGLTAGSEYCGELVASNALGTGHGFQVSFTSRPIVVTGSAEPTGAKTEEVSGTVDPAGQSTEYHVAYGLASSTWCTSGGTSGSPEHTTSTQALGFTDATSHEVSVTLSGLTAGSEYCAELVASNATSSSGGQVSFTSRPVVSAGSTEPSGATTEGVSGTVDPAGQTTTYHVAYGLTTSEWCTSSGSSGSPEHTTAAQTLGFSDATFHEVSVTLGGLSAGTAYCAELVASNATTASSAPVTFTAGAPIVFIGSATPTGATVEEVSWTVDPAGQTTTYHVAYGLAGSSWCTSGGSSGSPEHTTAVDTLGFTDASFHAVSVPVGGLSAGATYCAELVAHNATTASSGEVTFTGGAPSVSVGFPQPTGAGTEEISGEIDPSGQTTTYGAVYGLAGSSWCTSGGSSGSPEHTTVAQTLGFTDATFHPVSIVLNGLTAGSEYCAELVASNPSATTASGGQVTAFTSADQSTGAATEEISGEVDPAGQTTTYDVAYGLASSEWCTSSGSSGSVEHTTSLQTLAFTDATLHQVLVGLTGLSAGTAYCAELLASNGSGTGRGGQVTFTTASLSQPGASTANTATTSAGAPALGPTAVSAVVSGLRVSPSSFTAASSGGSASTSSKRKSKTGATVTYTLNTPATVTFTVREIQKGRLGKGGRCLAQTRTNHHARTCTLTVALTGSFSMAGAAGLNKLHFSGTLAGHPLKPGRYLLVATPKSASQLAGSATAGFQVIR